MTLSNSNSKTSLEQSKVEASSLPLVVAGIEASYLDDLDDLALIENTPIMVVRWTFPKDSEEIKFKRVSQNICHLGYSSQEILSGEIPWLDLVHPDDVLSIYKTVEKAIGDNLDSYVNNYRLKNKAGEYRWIEDHASIVRDHEGRVRYFQGVIIDITERKQVELELSQKNKYFQALHDTSLAITNRFDIKELTHSFAERLATLFDCEDVFIMLVNQETNMLDMFATTGQFENQDMSNSSIKYGEGGPGQAWQNAKELYVEDYSNYINPLQITISKIKSAVAIPLIVSDVVLGVMGLTYTTTQTFDDFTKEYLSKYAQLVAIALDNAQLHKSAELEIDERREVEKKYLNLFLEAKQTSQELRLLDEIQNTISSQLNLKSLFESVTQKISEIFDYSHTNIAVFQDMFFVIAATHGYTANSRPPNKIPKDDANIALVLEHKEPVLITSDNNTLLLSDKQRELYQSLALLPIIVNEKVYGIWTVASNKRDLESKDIELLQKIIELLVVAIENAQLHTQVKRELHRSDAMYKISQSVQESETLDKLMDTIVEEIRSAVGARWTIMYKIDFDRGYIQNISNSKYFENGLPRFTFNQLKDGLTGWALENKEAIFVKKNMVDSRENPEVTEARKGLNVGGFIVTPLIHRGNVLGTLQAINSSDDEDFSEEDVALLNAIANQTSVGLAQYDLRQKIKHQAYHDALTALPNRLLFEEELSRVITEAKESQKMFATMFLDLDGFKHVNDTLGHDFGDKLLKIVAMRLSSRTRKTDSLARMGGDEFAIILNDLSSKDEALSVGKSYLELFEDVFTIGKHSVRVGASIGISFYPEDAVDASTLLRHADSAMYQSKDSGKNSVSSFTPELAVKAKERLELETELRETVKQGGLELYYQPQICFRTNVCIGVEALLRWNHPTLGFISPAKFIPIAEESKLILDIGKWVIQKACIQNALWQAEGHKAITMAINISAVQFESPDFIDIVVDALRQSSLEPKFLEIEVTESVVMKDMNIIIDRLGALRSLGISIAIDDFGTGYSSLQYLQKLPLDKLKIDRSFVNEIEEGSSAPIASSILALAQSLNLKTVAEGIEEENQIEFLRLLGCDEAQGFYYAKPMPASEIWQWYAETHISTDATTRTFVKK